MDINFSQRDIFLYFVIKVFMVDSEFKIVHNEMNTIKVFLKIKDERN